MGKARILILLVAALAGGAAFFLVSTGRSPADAVVEAIPTQNSGQTVKVLVAAENVPQGAVLDPRATEWISWPKSSVPEFYVTEKNEEFVEALPQMRARRAIQANEAIFEDNVIRHDDRGMLAAIMSPGMRAVSTKVTAELTAGGFILPGDRVDVFASGEVRSKDKDKNVVVASLLLSDVRVIAIDQLVGKSEEEGAIVARTVTLELPPEQVELFLMAREKSTITIVLRSIAEGLSTSQSPISNEVKPDDVIVLRYGQG